MRDYLVFSLLGLGAGAVYAGLGLGLVLTYRASGVVNFAHGALAMYCTYVFVELRVAGDLVLPVVGLPHRLHLADRPPVVVALGAALAVAALLGLVLHWVVFRPLRSAPPLAGVAASVGLMVALQAVVVLHFGTANRSVPALLPRRPVELLGLTVPRDRLWLAALVVATAAALGAAHRFTRFGLATRAAAEDRVGVALLGWSPDALAAANWVLATVIGALFGILVGPVTALNPATYTLLVVPALAAALVGRLSSFAVTVAAALGLGAGQAVLARAQVDLDWLRGFGLREGLPLAVVVAVAAVGGDLLPGRAAPVERALPSAGRPRRPVAAAVAAAGVTAVAVLVLDGTWRLALVTSMTGAIVCLSLVVLTGYGGQVSLAQMAFAGLAGFSLAKLGVDWDVPFPLAPLLAVAVATAAGVAVGLPALRLRGASLAVVTLAAAVAVEELVFRNVRLTGGFRGQPVPDPTVLGLDLGAGGADAADYPRPVFALAVLAVLAVTAVAVARLRRGPTGRRLLAVRANERAAAAAGVDVPRAKVTAFALSALIAGVAGTLVGYQQGRLSFESFGVFVSLSFLAVAYLGGIARIGGALVGGALVAGGVAFTALDRAADLGRYQLLASGVGLVVVAAVAPNGLAGLAFRRLRR